MGGIGPLTTFVKDDNYITMNKPKRVTTIAAKCSYEYRAEIERQAITLSVARQKKVSQTQLIKDAIEIAFGIPNEDMKDKKED